MAENMVSYDFFAMDTCFSVHLHDENNSTAECKSFIQNTLNNLNVLLDCHTESSTVSMLGQTGKCTSSTLAELINQTQTLEQQYGNAVQVSCRPLTSLWNIGQENAVIPTDERISNALSLIDDSKISVEADTVTISHDMALDFGAVAKGYALDKLTEILSEQPSLTYGVISASSAVLLYGQKPNGKPFTVDISDPNSDGILGTISIPSSGMDFSAYVATSGNSERFSEIKDETYGHIFDLSTGYPVDSDFASVTVITDSGLKADFLSTLIFIEGKENIESHLSADDYEVLAIDKEGKLYPSDTLDFEAKS